jgi:hypothetical protein
MSCRRPTNSSCDVPRDLLSRAYMMPAHWPFDAFPLVMELSTPGACDLYGNPNVCCQMTDAEDNSIEGHVREAITSVLHGCHRRKCRALDLGANNGWFSIMMLQQGASVIAVEPQADLARAMQETAKLNCVDPRRFRVYTARACAALSKGPRPLQRHRRRSFSDCMAPERVTNCSTAGWRLGGGKPLLHRLYGKRCAAKLGLPTEIGGVSLAALLLGDGPGGASSGASGGSGSSGSSAIGGGTLIEDGDGSHGLPGWILSLPRMHVDFIKMDADGPEGSWLEEIDALMSHDKLSVGAIAVEASFVRPALFQRLQNVHGFHFYRFDSVDARRLITRDGWDAFSPPGTYARIDRFDQHPQRRAAATFISRFSPTNLMKMSQYLTTKEEKNVVLGGGGHGQQAHGIGDARNASSLPAYRASLEDEVLSLRAVRHAFRARPGLSLQQWADLLQPIQNAGYASHPFSWLLTSQPLTPSVGSMPKFMRLSPEYKAAKRAGHLQTRDHADPSANMTDDAIAEEDGVSRGLWKRLAKGK